MSWLIVGIDRDLVQAATPRDVPFAPPPRFAGNDPQK
jgi:hypothetical protein